jgi:dienelactone hydrolase
MIIKILSFLGLLLVHGSVYSQQFDKIETWFKNDSVTIYADILIPEKPTLPTTGIAIIQGSGNSDRTNAWSATFAKFIAAQGYFVLLPDKRGTGKSTGDWRRTSFIELAKDAELSAMHLKNKMQLKKIGIMGLSQGGFIAPVAASQNQAINFVINIVGAAVTLEEQLIHEVTNTCKNEGLTPEEISEILKLHVLMKDYAFNNNWDPLHAKFKKL